MFGAPRPSKLFSPEKASRESCGPAAGRTVVWPWKEPPPSFFFFFFAQVLTGAHSDESELMAAAAYPYSRSRRTGLPQGLTNRTWKKAISEGERICCKLGEGQGKR